MNLAELQRNFRSWLVAPDDAIAGVFGAHAAQGLLVYQNNYRAQLIGCLEVSYPQVRRWLGDDAFREAAISHIVGHPPHAWTLDHYGSDFADTLLSLYPRNPDLRELAWIEWSLSEAFVAADTRALSRDVLAGVDWDRACLRLTPSLRLLPATTNADQIWFALDNDMTVPQGAMLDAPGGFAVWRKGFHSQLDRVDATTFDALCSLRDDATFASLCDRLVDRLGEDEGVRRAGMLLAQWMDAGIVADIDDGSDETSMD
ncbi:Putative DNA-binding domain-containing protein [Luteibacter sp. UNCMF331Sha3.1]|uniref:HvfC/BufC N-terminal domain-containing protein n=1 Tax=Luteibacter sp. UNCMF331Sha3.1 TaxID=1502760 RepID=UPI0008CCA3B3|nr:DNA-binding domain-containing protein [Luteibacter sp. UNCMF331Sha3.1]SEM47029.1 Putative DNA-binding domain-containing protein [Luteibacter sp. UNCMF331Sha3.1]